MIFRLPYEQIVKRGVDPVTKEVIELINTHDCLFDIPGIGEYGFRKENTNENNNHRI